MEKQLNQLIDLVGKGMDDTKSKLETFETRVKTLEESKADQVTISQYKEVCDSLKSQGETLEQMNERLHNLDSILEGGDKRYVPIVKAENEAQKTIREEFARMVLDQASIYRHTGTRFNSEFFKRAQIESQTGDGGHLMPVEYRAEIIRIVEQYGLARRLCRVVPMRHKEWEAPTNSDLPAVYWDTELSTVELSAPSESKVTFLKPKITAHKLIAIDTLSIELDEDAIPDIANFVFDLFAIAVAKEEDYQFLTSPGTGTEPFTGLLYKLGITDVTGAANTYAGCLRATGDTGGYNKLIDVMDAADEITADTGVWVFSNSILNGIRQVKDLNEMPLFATMEEGMLFGRPYYRSRVMPKMKDSGSQASKPFILFGDFRYHLMGDRMAMSLDTSPHAAFKEAGIVLRVIERIGFETYLTTPFSRLVTSS